MASRLKYPRRRAPAPSLWPLNLSLIVLLALLAAVAIWIIGGGISRL